MPGLYDVMFRPSMMIMSPSSSQFRRFEKSENVTWFGSLGSHAGRTVPVVLRSRGVWRSHTLSRASVLLSAVSAEGRAVPLKNYGCESIGSIGHTSTDRLESAISRPGWRRSGPCFQSERGFFDRTVAEGCGTSRARTSACWSSCSVRRLRLTLLGDEFGDIW